jgi:hypothetical protein
MGILLRLNWHRMVLKNAYPLLVIVLVSVTAGYIIRTPQVHSVLPKA